MKITALHSGGDWADASVEYLILPAGMKIEKEYGNYCRWLRNDYYPYIEGVTPAGFARNEEAPKYQSFKDWLIERGAFEPAEDELEVFEC